MKWLVGSGARAGAPTEAVLTVPGDKSISHRALMFGALAAGVSRVSNLAPGDDVRSTADCLRAMGASIEREHDGWRIRGGAISSPRETLYAGNSGTTMRLLTGILAGHPFESTIDGDEALRRRPMDRIAEPLAAMGALVETRNGHPPVHITGGDLRAIRFEPVVPSAQVKSCLLLAGLFARGATTVVERVKTRDHTERLMRFCGIPLECQGPSITVTGGSPVAAFEATVPGDFSSAALLLVLGVLGREITVRNVGINPTRTAFLSVLRRMGAEIMVSRQSEEAGEPVADISTRPCDLMSTDVSPEESPLLLDELPLVAFLGCLARGTSTIRGAAELRVKESDRIAAVAGELRKLGAAIEELPDGFRIQGGGRLTGAAVASHGDHRLAMMLAVAGSKALGQTMIDGAECVNISYPGFDAALTALGVSIERG